MHEYDKIPNVYKRNDQGLLDPTLGYFDEACYALRHSPWIATEKVDGMNIRIRYLGEEVVEFLGKTDRALLPPQLVHSLEKLREPIFHTFNGAVCLYGEGYGKGIQGDGGYRNDQAFILFDVKIGKWWLEPKDVEDIASALGVPVVPFVAAPTLNEATEQFFSRPPASLLRSGLAEGWVMRPLGGLLHRDGTPIRVKLKEKDFAKLRRS